MIIDSDFQPHPLLKSPHLQTLWAQFFPPPKYRGRAETLTLSDGDFLELEWFDAEGPLAIILHGLEGSIDSAYARAICKTLHQANYQVLFMHFRGCGEATNLKARSYHSGDTQDFQEVLDYAQQVTGKTVDTAIGYSLGGNVLLKYLGEQGTKCKINKAVAVSVPFQLADAAKRLEKGPSRLYQHVLIKRLRRSYERKFSSIASPLKVDVNTLNTFCEFDDAVTAPLNGFKDVHEYYAQSSSRQFIPSITTNTLIIHAKDDPFMFQDSSPTTAELPICVKLELTEHGGHVGFISGTFMTQRWLEPRILRFISS